MDSITIDTPQELHNAIQRHQQELASILHAHLAQLTRLQAEATRRTEWENTPLNLQQGAAESGYSADHLGRLVKNGEITNAGRENAPKILRKDLPRRPGRGLTPPTLTLHGPGARSALHNGGVER